ncbi:glycosyltransferase family 39 protein [Streptomyces sp. ME02-8801-2C]|uniref:glycosyltransferase family 39 protein n=1 Tax=Streptomyces sp. ME02-8801-2C TaxID=3028680 RepID=UPI0029BDA0CE|nr:glycosyltransferase family 39 protein [Streptomyces sp. ME02-8801-2C]MDX3451938.1 glycosyltransferase family 39 protein [Streptomyces sp. ME02-8801-2C]
MPRGYGCRHGTRHRSRPGHRSPPLPGTARPARRPGRLWLWPTAVTLLLALYRIGEPLLGRDELTSWDMAGRGTGQVLATLRSVDAVVGTYYLLLHERTGVFGNTPVAVRLPSALAMAGTAACVALIGNRLFGRRAGLAGGLLFALIPGVSRFAHEARPYALVIWPSLCPAYRRRLLRSVRRGALLS